MYKLKKGKQILCKSCGTKKYRDLNKKGDKTDYGFIVCHKKDCKYLKSLLKNSVEV